MGPALGHDAGAGGSAFDLDRWPGPMPASRSAASCSSLGAGVCSLTSGLCRLHAGLGAGSLQQCLLGGAPRARPLGGAPKLFCMRGCGGNLITVQSSGKPPPGGCPSQASAYPIPGGRWAEGRRPARSWQGPAATAEGRALPNLAPQEHASRMWAEVDNIQNPAFWSLVKCLGNSQKPPPLGTARGAADHSAGGVRHVSSQEAQGHGGHQTKPLT